MEHKEQSELKPTILVIFGITGDLSQRYLLPALYHLELYNMLPKDFLILGVSRKRLSKKEQTKLLKGSIAKKVDQIDKVAFKKIYSRFNMLSFDPAQDADYKHLREYIDETEDKYKVCFNRLFYLAVPPSIFSKVIKRLGSGNLNTSCQHKVAAARILVEKPFGFDLSTAHELINQAQEYFTEEQIYRIDHYLAKETAQNILTFRFKNPLFEQVWDRHSIAYMQITVAETLGVAGREDFYEQTGALRDMVQSHLLQLMSLTTMEQPENLLPTSIHRQRQRLLEAIKPITSQNVLRQTVRGQYTSGKVYGETVASYKQDVGKNSSITETYAAIKFDIENERWQGVPILMRVGKRLSDRYSEISIVFKESAAKNIAGNVLSIRIVPNEGIALKLVVKKPGFVNETESVSMDFCYRRSFDGRNPDAYEKLLIDAIKGDQTLFPTGAEVIASWKSIDAVVKAWQQNGNGLAGYQAGSWGPKEADELAKKYCSGWLPYDPAVCRI
jgi:glucose-6-phosphate 1-dehydrogenase